MKLEPREIKIHPALKEAFEWIVQNPNASETEKVNVAGAALRDMEYEDVLYMAAVGLTHIPISIVYQEDVETKAIPGAIKIGAFVAEKEAAENRSAIASNAAEVANKNRQEVAQKIQAEWQKLAEQIWREPGRKEYKNIDVARIIRTRTNIPDDQYPEKYIASKIKKPTL